MEIRKRQEGPGVLSWDSVQEEITWCALRGVCGYCSSDRICLLACVCFCCGMPCSSSCSSSCSCSLILMLIATYLTLPCLYLILTALAFWLFLSLRRYTANCISRMGLRSLWLAGFQSSRKIARALHHFVAALGKLWQRLAARETQGPAPVPQGRPGRASATIPPPPPRRRHNRTIFPPYGLKDPSSGNLAHGGGRIFPRGHMYVVLLNHRLSVSLPATPRHR